MREANNYKFHNVLVADTKLLVPTSRGTGSQQPDVLILNSKLNKCQAHQTYCASCCLYIERPEFRRRSGPEVAPNVECFADCGRRRPVDVELNAKAQLSGKLVIFAFSKIDHAFDTLSGGPIKCQIQNSWSFSRFDPPNHSVGEPKQISYSRLSSNQAPSMLINSVNISWDPDSHRELLSLTINPSSNQRPLNSHQPKQQVILKETLLVSELDCYQPSVEATNRSASLFDDHPGYLEPTTPRKVHLMTLINRQLSSNSSHSAPINDSGSAQRSAAKVDPAKSVDVAPESYIDYPPVAPKTLEPGGQPQASSIAPVLTRARSIQGATSVSQSNYAPSSSGSSSTRQPNEAIGSVLRMKVPFLNNKYEFKTNESSQMGPSFLTEHDLIPKIRLKSSGFLVLAISSGLVILTYTLCLIAYLRWRNKVRSKGRASVNNKVYDDNDDAVVPIQRVGLDISQPYNLQMPSATRTRLEIMLRRDIRPGRPEAVSSASHAKAPRRSNRPKSSVEAELRLAERRRRSRLLMSATNQDEPIDDYRPRMGESAGGGQYARAYKQRQLNFGSINVVRAIRQAATLARSRLHLHSRYRPNLNVIPESDLEYLQSPRGEMYRGLFDHNNLVYISPPRRGAKSGEAQFDTLVQDALRTDCSHYVEKLTSQAQAQATVTLFSRPIEGKNLSDPVSRSEILRQVKQEDLFGNQDSERAEI